MYYVVYADVTETAFGIATNSEITYCTQFNAAEGCPSRGSFSLYSIVAYSIDSRTRNGGRQVGAQKHYAFAGKLLRL